MAYSTPKFDYHFFETPCIEQVLAYMTLNEELDNMNLRNNFGYSYVNIVISMYLISYFVIKLRLDTRRN